MVAGRYVIEPARGCRRPSFPRAGGDPKSSLGGPRTAHEVAVLRQLKPSATRASPRAPSLRSTRGGTCSRPSNGPISPSSSCSSPALPRSNGVQKHEARIPFGLRASRGILRAAMGLLHRSPGTIRRHRIEAFDDLPKAGRDGAKAQCGRFVNGDPGHEAFSCVDDCDA